jgi:hypothetical protein
MNKELSLFTKSFKSQLAELKILANALRLMLEMELKCK